MIDRETDRWNAVCRRIATSNFVFGVRTTRIACRPGCPSRTPRVENVRFFDDFAAARVAGFRACKRCRPDDVAPDAERQRSISRACAVLDTDDTVRLADVAASIGLSRFHFQRMFRDVLGVTPGDYRRARREERLRRGLAAGQSVTDAIATAGYGSPSRAYEADPLGMTPSAYRSGGRGETVMYAIAAASLGRVLVACSARGICAIELGDDDAAVVAALRRDLPEARIVHDDAALAENLAAVVKLVDGDDAVSSALELDLRGTAFQRRVWTALRAIPLGERRSYAAVAVALGRTGSARAVAAACARNPLAVAVPCHRVVGTDGGVKGYRWACIARSHYCDGKAGPIAALPKPEANLLAGSAEPMRRSLLALIFSAVGIGATVALMLREKTPIATGWAVIVIGVYVLLLLQQIQVAKRESIYEKYSLAQKKSGDVSDSVP